MSVPREKSGWAQRVEVAVESAAGSGVFLVDDRLRADTVETLSDGGIGTAHISVRTGGDFTPAAAAEKYHADRRIIVQTGESVLFDGYPSVSRLAWGRGGSSAGAASGSGRRDREFGLELEHVIGRLERDVRGQILGRYVRDSMITDGLAVDPDGWRGASAGMSGLPCIFNLDGGNNCDPLPIKVSDGAGGIREIHIFTDDRRADAVAWTYAKVLRYLLHFHMGGDCPVQCRPVFEGTEEAAGLSGEGREAFLESDPLAYALLGRPDTLVLEATSLLEAVASITADSGLHLTAQSTASGAGGVDTSLRVWSELSGSPRELCLATDARDGAGAGVYDPAAKAVVDLFEDNNVSAAALRWDARSIGQTAVVLGDVKRHEVAVELMPGWLPEEDLDNVSAGQRADAKAKALVDEQIVAMGEAAEADGWYRAYHRGGEDFAASWQVGRLWVLNETGTYEASQYDRNAPFDSYAAHDFSATLLGRWMRRYRRLLPVAITPGGPEQVWLEVSFDGGVTWFSIDSGYNVLPGECGIWFDVPNLLSISPPDGNLETNLWYALIDQVYRVRVTALIESDERLVAEASSSAAPTVFRNATVLYAPERFRFLRRLDGSGGGMAGSAETSADRDDSASMGRVAASMASVRGSLSMTARPVIPWLDTSYAIGDRIVGVRGRGIQFSAERAPSRRRVCVVGKRYRLGSGRFETELILATSNGVDGE